MIFQVIIHWIKLNLKTFPGRKRVYLILWKIIKSLKNHSIILKENNHYNTIIIINKINQVSQIKYFMIVNFSKILLRN